MKYESLNELAARIKGVVISSFKEEIIVLAEIKKKTTNVVSGHCYLELVDTDHSQAIYSKLTGFIWKKNVPQLEEKFKKANLTLDAGIKTLFKVSVTFHTVLGVGLEINDISTNYIRGELEVKKDAIREKLKSQNIYSKNKSLAFPFFVKRIAVLAATGSAGLSDFQKTLLYHKDKIGFYIEHFNIHVQGFNAKSDIVKGFQYLNGNAKDFDIIVLLRGGGSASDLEVFNDYDIAQLICTCSIPVMVGIGHSTDSVILDEVAYKSAMTPTDLANSINNHTLQIYENIITFKDNIFSKANELILQGQNNIQTQVSNVKNAKNKLLKLDISLNKHKDVVLNIQKKLSGIEQNISLIEGNIKASSGYSLKGKGSNLEHLKETIFERSKKNLEAINQKFNHSVDLIHERDPNNLINNRGYSITLLNGKTLKNIDKNLINEIVTTILKAGIIESKVSKVTTEG